MTELEKYQRINSSESFAELKTAITEVAGEDGVEGTREKVYNAEHQCRGVDLVLQGSPPNVLTRSYGIRQQMLYLIHYAKF